jgi:hypothetical protein
MQAKNITVTEMEQALAALNKKYAGNVTWNRFDTKGRHIEFTLRVKSSKGLGAKLGSNGRRSCAACWHTHGNFFEEALKIQSNAVFTSSWAKIDRYGGNWQDKDIGSMMQPQMFSEACQCQ